MHQQNQYEWCCDLPSVISLLLLDVYVFAKHCLQNSVNRICAE